MEENWLNDEYVRYYNRAYATSNEEFAQYVELLRLQPDDVLLDLGCGDGTFLALAAPHVQQAYGVDISPLQVELANERLRSLGNAQALCSDFVGAAATLRSLSQLPPITKVFSRKALHHLTEPQKRETLQTLSPLLAPGALIYFEDGIFYNFERDAIRENLPALLEECARYYGESWESKRNDLLNSFLNEFPSGLGFWTQELNAIGFQVTQTMPRCSFYGGLLAKRQ